MPENSYNSSSIPLPAILTALSAIGGVLLFLPSLTSSRPPIPMGRDSGVIGYQDVDARLWQDPLQAIDDRLAVQKNGTFDPATHSLAALTKQLVGAKSPVRILEVMLSGLPYAEDAESRLRTRLAVVSGLGRARYRPKDNSHLGVITIRWPRDALVLGTDQVPILGAKPSDGSTVPADDHLSLNVPYEWWTAQDSGTSDPRDVLILWLREESFCDFPLRRLSDLTSGLGPANSSDVQVIGPAWSSTLRLMVWEADSGVAPWTKAALAKMSIWSPAATASNDLLQRNLINKWGGAESLEKWFNDRAGLGHFKRTIATDDVTCETLTAELGRRGVTPGAPDSHIVLVAESDTPYGRWLPLTFAAKVAGVSPSTLFEKPSLWPASIDRFSYLRGIDGQLPGEAQNNDTAAAQSQAASTAAPAGITPPPSRPAEETEGRNQADGLRRLAEQIVDRDREYRLDGSSIQAVGVLGSDVYDKLLILKALRKELPNALFFTTDLDARYSHPAEVMETHNLIIASPFDLRLNHQTPHLESAEPGSQTLFPLNALQGDITPFRDDYQTSTFLSTLMSLGKAKVQDSSINAVRLFEIGRNGPFNLSHDDDPIHPPRADGMEPMEKLFPWRWAPVLLVCAAVYASLCHFSPDDRLRFRPWQWPKRAWLFVCPMVIVAMVFLIAMYSASGVDGVPWALIDGVSLWPTEIVRLVASFVAIALIFDTHNQLALNDEAIGRDFRLARARSAPVPFLTRLHSLPIKSFWNAEIELSKWGAKQRKGLEGINASKLWKEYKLHGDASRRLARVVLFAGIYVLTAICALLGFFGKPNFFVPMRGNASYWIDTCCWVLAALSILSLNFYVGDAARVCKLFSRKLASGYTEWPPSLLRHTASRRQMPTRELSEYLDVILLARRTDAIMHLLYYPFIVLTLTIAARNQYFANWDWPLPLLIIFAAHLIYAIYQYATLRNAAEDVRQRAIKLITTRIVRDSGNDTHRRKLEDTLKEVTDISNGAFAPFTRNPVVGAVLIPFASFAGWMLIQLFMQNG